MGHDHSHSHGGHGHHHAVADTADARKRVAFAAVLTFAFMIAEVAGGIISGSLALLADAAHMLTDAGSLGLAWLGFRLAERPADDQRSFGWARFKIPRRLRQRHGAARARRMDRVRGHPAPDDP
ncbi:cation diffusion facilitator family transporter [Henriciella sp.]|uniref:cation diffusion facilitator family transporter n=1 Tax=Henriciella sp. TaxID=1968823 RepID=UPI002614EBE8|nr:cation diffusion facilitator family transporter [Henriciella sp.]